MSYIAPNSTVQFFRDVGLNDNYNDSAWFGSTTVKDRYFDGIYSGDYGLAQAQAMSYTREQRGFVRVELPMSTLINASYMRYKNTSFENKWFYAFIKNVEYINNNCTQVNFEIDPLMTWMGSFTLNECFIERCHTTTDNVGDNILPEDVALGEYVYNDYQDIQLGNGENAIIIAIGNTEVLGTSDTRGNKYDGVYSGLTLYAYNDYNISQISDVIDQWAYSPDSIVAMYMLPKAAIAETIPALGGLRISSTNTGKYFRQTLDTLSASAGLNGYYPKNKKLYTYPFNFVNVDNGNGGTLVLRYEFFTDNTVTVEITTNIVQPIEIVLRPYNYKGSGVNTLNTETLEINGFPICGWVSDAYKAWLAQSSVGYNADLLFESGKGIFNVLTANIPGVTNNVNNVLDQTKNRIVEDYQASIAADFSRGSQTGGSNRFSSGHLHFSYGRLSINAQYARMIDHYFDLYGYAYKKHGVPNPLARQFWNYIKTIGCSISGDIPADDASKIENIFNNGIRFWRGSTTNIGNYNLDNSPY